MKLNRLESTTQRHSPEAIARGNRLAAQTVRRVEALEGLEGDRQRSLQQELAEFDQRVIGPFAGDGQVFQEARQIAAQLILRCGNLNGLVRLQALSLPCARIDDEA
jgi:hypothetical protein